ncbi:MULTISPECIES: NAD-dependent succinate-semialdehyde dehydrogenase [unclassified Oceanobacter]|jgi:succinate-semialdehyde dehydrogenase/glutarate-semialdehyde dehydrogenase|uniref:NAD-dependent succinate-semialdehyde dehydrogenase n=1 Tax=unclassified Oceanobacter TaxID=2620260 RepID=UPI0026E2C726|nr:MULTISPECIES: NAD-dependent succinate-semialdehyde dehydrogenase [unclassified Oceanobacter]MDO6683118.1 NAD-dependent succinate-semialdehyde dehydrogenase [Oceanobacter sp. 5_MG-2023]MDP2547822.1 NAD-dependent succinate-semialdehyde dehydrogenase [Oceanobacter sp. 4_MG-2023]MDP2608403.1 NAD-dependent succinate-semialdehyde dehydrogenase [Oceanobacter sp. 1_MG-2023]MDP2611498.1 NAD-dependent succinate-semialdehyde dehydrogenase [Oceanobacter sp. 2_MG-2023]
MLTVTNPTTGMVLETYATHTPDEMNQRIELVASAYHDWGSARQSLRSKVMLGVAAKLRERKQALAEMMALEMGKPILEGVAEVEKAAWCTEHYAEQAETYLNSESIESDATQSYVTYQPLGAVLGILPWNAPLWLAFRFLAPALMAGNTCVMKHDPNVQGCARLIETIFDDVCAVNKVPAHIMVNLTLATEQIETAIRHPAIQAVSFTGSSAAGAQVASIAAAEIKPAVLELGGSDPCIVMADADLDKAADIVVLSRMINAGQSCIAAKRILVEAPIYDEFIDKLASRMDKLVIGDPLLDDTQVGPIARQNLLTNLHRQVSDTINAGARCLLGGEPLNRPGFYYPPTLLVDVQPGMVAFEEETFGPVMAVMKVDDFEHAIKIANATDYGLGASIWTNTPRQKRQAILRLQAGQVAINGIVKTDPRLPSGGIKKSGYGRELGPHGIREFTNAKQVWIG